MTITVIILSIVVVILSYKLYAKRNIIDSDKVLNNRLELINLARKDWEQDKINKDLYRTLCFVFHPDFKNIWGYIPPDRQVYTSQICKLDSNFWKSYKISPDFVIPASMVYELYKEFISQHVNDFV